jgi:hypothetical protein
LHLLTLPRLRTVELSTFRFLFDSYVQQRRKLKFLEALLAMLRALFLLLLVLLICRPAIKNWNRLFGTGTSREVVVLLDCSASMNAREAGVAAIDRAKKVAASLLDHLGKEDRLTFVRVASHPEEVFSSFTRDAEAIREKIEATRTSSARANFFTALTSVLPRLKNSSAGKDAALYILTDCQSNGWREAREQGLGREVPEGTQIYLVNVGSRAAGLNLAVIGDAPRRNRVIAGLPLVLQPRVANYSKDQTVLATLSVLIEDKEVARAQLNLKPGEVVTQKFVYLPADPGTLHGRFEISSKEPESFLDDNRFLFTINVEPRVKVLLVSPNPNADISDNDAVYLRTALTAPRDDEPAAAPAIKEAKRTLATLEVEDIPEWQLSPDKLKDASVVILSNCGGINGQHFAWLREFVSSGGGLLIFPGDHVNPDAYNREFFASPGVPPDRMTAAQWKPAEGDPNRGETFERFGAIDYSHGVFSIFDDPQAKYFATVHFGRRFPIELPKTRHDTWTLAEFSGGLPALVESRFHDGRVILAAFPAQPKWTNLPLKPAFVPLVLRMISEVKHRPALEVPSVVPAESSAEISLAGNSGTATGAVIDAAGKAHALEFERSASRLLAAFEGTGARGYYKAETKNTGPNARPESAAFAVNLAAEESSPERLDERQFREMMPGPNVTYVDASAEAQQLLGSIGEEREIWRPLIFILFAIIGMEFLLATLSGQAKEQESLGQRVRRLNPVSWIGRMTGAPAATTE